MFDRVYFRFITNIRRRIVFTTGYRKTKSGDSRLPRIVLSGVFRRLKQHHYLSERRVMSVNFGDQGSCLLVLSEKIRFLCTRKKVFRAIFRKFSALGQ